MKKLFAVLLLCFTLMFCGCAVLSSSAATVDEAVINSQDDNYVPLYTIPPKSISNSNFLSFSSKDYALFYTQTTFLALIAGYLILFKVKCLKKDEKIHKTKETTDKSR